MTSNNKHHTSGPGYLPNTYYAQQGKGRSVGPTNKRVEPSLGGIFNNNNNQQQQSSALSSPLSLPGYKSYGLATNNRARETSGSPQQIDPLPNSLRNYDKNYLANEYGKTKYYPFDSKRTTDHVTGTAHVNHRPDHDIFKPKLDPQPARRLHDINEAYLRQIWEEDNRKEIEVSKMEKNSVNSPIHELRRGGGEEPFRNLNNGSKDPSNNSGGAVSGSSSQQDVNIKLSPRQNITDLHNKADPVHGCRHFTQMYRTNFELAHEEVGAVSAGRRKFVAQPGATKAVMY